jgi:hypothetical protein
MNVHYIASSRNPRQNRGFFMRRGFPVRLPAIDCVPWLRRILRRLFVAKNRTLEVLVGDLQVKLPRYGFAVADPAADDVGWEAFHQLRFPSAAKALSWFAPWR